MENQLPIQDRLNPIALLNMQLRIDMDLNEVALKKEWKENKGRIMKSYMDTVSQLKAVKHGI